MAMRGGSSWYSEVFFFGSTGQQSAWMEWQIDAVISTILKCFENAECLEISASNTMRGKDRGCRVDRHHFTNQVTALSSQSPILGWLAAIESAHHGREFSLPWIVPRSKLGQQVVIKMQIGWDLDNLL
jgi:hypothetical protein